MNRKISNYEPNPSFFDVPAVGFSGGTSPDAPPETPAWRPPGRAQGAGTQGQSSPGPSHTTKAKVKEKAPATPPVAANQPRWQIMEI